MGRGGSGGGWGGRGKSSWSVNPHPYWSLPSSDDRTMHLHLERASVSTDTSPVMTTGVSMIFMFRTKIYEIQERKYTKTTWGKYGKTIRNLLYFSPVCLPIPWGTRPAQQTNEGGTSGPAPGREPIHTYRRVGLVHPWEL